MPAILQSNSFFLNSISVNEIAEEISYLKTSKSCGPFSVPVKILKLIKEHISVPLATIFNCSISSSTLPDKFKIASVIPVHNLFLITIDPSHYFQFLMDFLKD